MKSRRHWELAAAIAAALWMMLLGSEARAERLWTERAAEMRASPGDDSQELRKVPKGKSVEVVKRLGTWVMVQYDGRTGWIRRTVLSSEPVSGSGGDDEGADEEKSEKKSKKKAASRDEDEAEESEGEPKAAAAGAKRTAAKKKADRKKSRKARHGKSEARDDEDEAEADEDDAKPRRGRSTWGERGRVAGGPLKVEIQALSVKAFSEPDGSGSVVFTVSEGERVRVIARGENRWLLVENSKKKTGWIPAFAVRDNGELPEARKSSSKAKADDEASEDEEAPGAEEEEVSETRSKSKSKGKSKTRTASADDESEDEGSSDEGEEEDSGERKSSDDVDASLGASSSDDEFPSARKDWTATVGLRAGYTALGMDVTPDGGTAEKATYAGPTASLVGDIDYRLRPKIAILGELTYDWSTALGGLGVTPDGGSEIDGGSVMSHRIAASVGVGYGKRMAGSLRIGYQYAIFNISDIDNDANWPRESTSGPTAGLGFSWPEVAGTKIGLKVGLDALLFGSRSQTEGRRDGAELDSLTALWGGLRLDYPIGEHLLVDGGYRLGYAKASWSGLSDRNGAMATDRKDLSHELSLGVGWRL